MNGIPDGNHKRSIKALIEKMARNIYNIYQQKRYHHRRAAKFKKTLVKYGLFKHGNINEDSNDPETIRRRKLQLDDYMEHHAQMVNDDYNMRLCYVKYQYYKDPENFSFLKPMYYKIFVKNQIELNRSLSRNVDYGCSLVMSGVVHNWSRRRWNNWNRYVCIMFIYCLSVFLC